MVTLEEFTTPGISFLASHMAATFGVVVSASHNPFWDNGIKVFEGVGFKASDELEQQIEEMPRTGAATALPATCPAWCASTASWARSTSII